MRPFFASLGSNVDANHHLDQALQALTERFGPLQTSSRYCSPPIDGKGADYINQVIRFETEDSIADVVNTFKTIEKNLGRQHGQKQVSIDIDLLLAGDACGIFSIYQEKTIELPHPDITQYAHVLIPLLELAPNLIHPSGLPLSELKHSLLTNQATLQKIHS